MNIDRSDLQGIGIASSTPFTNDVSAVTDEARHVEQLGFTMLWRSGVLPMVEAAMEATERIPIGTGIIAVSNVPAADVVATHHRLDRDHPGRFVVGLGGAHDAQPLRTLGPTSTRSTRTASRPAHASSPRSDRTCWTWHANARAVRTRTW